MPTIDLLAEYVPRSDLAKQLKVCDRTLERWERLGTGPVVTRIGNRTFYHLDDVRAWLRALRRPPPSRRRRRSA